MRIHENHLAGQFAADTGINSDIGEAELLQYLISNWGDVTHSRVQNLSKRDLQARLPEGPAKNAMLEYFEAILLFSDKVSGKHRGRREDRIAVSHLGKDDLQHLLDHVNIHGSIEKAFEAFASELMSEHGIETKGDQTPLQAVRAYVENEQRELGIQDDSVRGFYRAFEKLADYEGGEPDVEGLASLAKQLKAFLDSPGRKSVGKRGRKKLEKLLERVLTRAQGAVASKLDSARSDSEESYRRLAEFLNTARALGLQNPEGVDVVSPLSELLERISGQIRDIDAVALPGDVDFNTGVSSLVTANQLAESFAALGDLLQNGTDEVADLIPATIAALFAAAEKQQASQAESVLDKKPEEAREQLKPLTNFTANRLIGDGDRPEDGLHESLYGLPENLSVQALVQWVLRESYLDVTKDLKDYADKLKFFMEKKKAIRAEIADLRNVRSQYAGQEPTVELGDSIKPKTYTEDYNTYKASGSMNAGTKAQQGEPIETVEELDTHLKNLEEQLQTVGEDMQLAQVDLQNIMQKQQQTLQLMSNISKMVHDTSMSIIRKIG